MNAELSNAVFISYRRDASGPLATALYQQLSQRGLKVFFDIENIRAGKFRTIILNQIATHPYFLLVLTPGTLDRCGEPKDVLHQEIEQARATRRTIVPVYTPAFDFSDFERFLPRALAEHVQEFNAQELPHKWFKFAVEQLIEEFLVPVMDETLAAPAAEEAIVDQVLRDARAAPTVTDVQLSAHEYFERAHARAEGDAEGKIADYSEALRLHPGYAEALNNRGVARRSNGDLEGAISDFTQALRLNPGFAEAFINRGLARYRKGDLEGTIADNSQALRINPMYAQAFTMRGLARGDKGDLDGAIADHSEALRVNPEYAEAFTNRGIARYYKGDLEGAIADHSEALRVNPEYAEAFNNRGVARHSKGDLEGAIADYSEALRLNPGNAQALTNRGAARSELGI